jgi:hypothetical protein
VPAPGESQDSSCLASKTQCRKKKQGVIADRLIEGAQELWGKWTLNVLKYQHPDGARSALNRTEPVWHSEVPSGPAMAHFTAHRENAVTQ